MTQDDTRPLEPKCAFMLYQLPDSIVPRGGVVCGRPRADHERRLAIGHAFVPPAVAPSPQPQTWESGWCPHCNAPRLSGCERMRLIPAYDSRNEYSYQCAPRALPQPSEPCPTCKSTTQDECARNDCPESYKPVAPSPQPSEPTRCAFVNHLGIICGHRIGAHIHEQAQAPCCKRIGELRHLEHHEFVPPVVKPDSYIQGPKGMSLGPDDRIPVFEVSGPDAMIFERVDGACGKTLPNCEMRCNRQIGHRDFCFSCINPHGGTICDCPTPLFEGDKPSTSPTPNERRCPSCGQWLLCMECLHAPHVAPCEQDTGDATGSYGECGCTFIASASPTSNEDERMNDTRERCSCGRMFAGELEHFSAQVRGVYVTTENRHRGQGQPCYETPICDPKDEKLNRLAAEASPTPNEDARMCICGHDFGSHNDITKRCCFKVMTGWDQEIDLPAMRMCNLCPPSGFKEAIPNDSDANCWPEGERINRDELRGLPPTPNEDAPSRDARWPKRTTSPTEIIDAIARDILASDAHLSPTADLNALAEMEKRKDAAYEERNRVVAVLARMALAMGFKACRTRTAIEGWSDDWHGCVFIELPCGQVSWHFHDSQAHLFADMPEDAATWDGHTTEQKYERLNAYRPSASFTDLNALAEEIADETHLADCCNDSSCAARAHERARVLAILQRHLTAASLPDTLPEACPGCGVCGGATVEIRGRHPSEPRRVVCPTCAVERLEAIKDMRRDQGCAQENTT